MFHLLVPKTIPYLIECFALFLYPFSFLIHSIQETFLEELILEIFSCLLDTVPVLGSYFLLIKLFLLTTIFINSFKWRMFNA